MAAPAWRKREGVGAIAAGARLGLALCTACAAPLAARGQPAPPPPAAAASASVIPYPASFFAAMRPDTAYDMVLRLPGFTFDDGSAVRGFAGAAGNVLIDGQRPASKTDDLVDHPAAHPGRPGRAHRPDPRRRAGHRHAGQDGGRQRHPQGRRRPSAARPRRASSPRRTATPTRRLRLEGTWRGGDRTPGGLALSASRATTAAKATAERTYRRTRGSGAATSRRRATPRPTGSTSAPRPTRRRCCGGQFRAQRARWRTSPYRLRQHRRLPRRRPPATSAMRPGRRPTPSSACTTTGDLAARLSLEPDRPAAPEQDRRRLDLRHRRRQPALQPDAAPAARASAAASCTGGRSPTLTVDGGRRVRLQLAEDAHALPRQRRARSPCRPPTCAVAGKARRGVRHGDLAARLDPHRRGRRARRDLDDLLHAATSTLAKTLTFPKPRLLVDLVAGRRDQLRLRVEREVGQLDFGSFVASALAERRRHRGRQSQPDAAAGLGAARRPTSGISGGRRRLADRPPLLQITDVIDRAPVFSPSGVFDAPGQHRRRERKRPRRLIQPAAAAARGPRRDAARPGDLARLRGDRPDHRRRRAASQASTPVDAELHFTQDLPAWNLSWGVDLNSAVPGALLPVRRDRHQPSERQLGRLRRLQAPTGPDLARAAVQHERLRR